MLSSYDDFPIHQTGDPIVQTVSADPNHYDRYFFNGYSPEGDVYFAVALGVYPNRGVMDAAVSVLYALLAGSIILTSLKQQLPGSGRLDFLVLGGACIAFTVLLLAI